MKKAWWVGEVDYDRVRGVWFRCKVEKEVREEGQC